MKSNLENAMQEIIIAGWNHVSGGDVEAPTGHFAVVEIPENETEMEQMIEAANDYGSNDFGPTLQTMARGWYTVREDSNGSVFVSDPITHAEAMRWFKAMEEEFSVWFDQDADDI